MKNSIILMVFASFFFSLLFVACGGGSPDGSNDSGESGGGTGSIYGIVTDKATGEPLKSAGVELFPVGLKTVTGSDGSFEFLDISAGYYNLFVTKTGYGETKSSTIVVESGKSARGDVQLEKASAALRIVDDEGNDIPDPELDFGARLDDVSRSFNIFNDSLDSLDWKITKTADWIKSISEESGELKAGKTLGIIVVIDRSLLREGENITQLHITSNNGNKQLRIKATNSDVVTLDATRIKTTSATLNGELIVNDEEYTETGFVYGGMATPSFDNDAMTVSNSSVQLGSFGNAVSDLGESRTYYYRAYAKNDTKTVYGETKSFSTLKIDEYVTLSGGLVVAKKDAGKVNWYDAIDMCNNYTLAEFTDWHLPTKDELLTVYNNKNSIGNFVEGRYWSSSTWNGYNSYLVSFTDGSVTKSDNENSFYVRCVRTAN
jgi:hypothetical protein